MPAFLCVCVCVFSAIIAVFAGEIAGMNIRSAHVNLHLAVLLFGLSGLFGKWIDLDPALIVFARTLIAALTIGLGLRWLSKPLLFRSRQVLVTVFLSGAVLALHWITFFKAIQMSTVAIGLLGFSTFPVFVTFIEPILSGQSVRRIDVVSAVLVMLGLYFVVPDFDLANQNTVGLFWAVFSGALFAVLTLMNRRLVADQPVMQVAFLQHCSAALVVLPMVIGVSAFPAANEWALLLALGLLCTALPHTLFIQSLTAIKAQLASVVAGLEPVYGIVFAAIFLHEIPSVSTVFGGVLVLLAVAVAIKAHATDKEPRL